MCWKYALQSIGQMLERLTLISRSSFMESNRMARVSSSVIVINLQFEFSRGH